MRVTAIALADLQHQRSWQGPALQARTNPEQRICFRSVARERLGRPVAKRPLERKRARQPRRHRQRRHETSRAAARALLGKKGLEGGDWRRA